LHKIVRRVINHKYVSIKPESLVEGSIINFDCYIKRFDDFVIIIERGTLITAELSHKVKQNDKVYIEFKESEAFKNYKKIYGLDTEITVVEALKLENVLSEVNSLEEKLTGVFGNLKVIEMVYKTTALLMEAIFNDRNEKLPVEAIQKCAKYMVNSITCDEDSIMPSLLHLMPDEYSTHHHSTNVAMFSTILGKTTGIPSGDLIHLTCAALMHDIGKVRIDEKILLKSSSLDEDEYEQVKTHSEAGYEILKTNGVTNPKVLDAVLHHHEKLDGKGYPSGLRGKRIPKFARIIGMCDVFDALTTRRTYRINYSSYEALLLMKQEMADQFDVHYSDTFIRLLGSKKH